MARGLRRRPARFGPLRPLVVATLVAAVCAAVAPPSGVLLSRPAATSAFLTDLSALSAYPQLPAPADTSDGGADAGARRWRADEHRLRAAVASASPEVALSAALPSGQRARFPVSSAGSGARRGTPAAGSFDIPGTVLAAYRNAETRSPEIGGGCYVPWYVLAGIGKVETGHGRFGGATAAPDGYVSPRITGPQLNGSGATAAIRDSDGGRWDGDTVWDRAVGPMQFIPTSWRAYGRDGSGDGDADPNNIFDAALGAAAHLCRSAPGDMRNPEVLRRALYSYNHSWDYVATVSSWIDRYAQTTSGLPSTGDNRAAPPISRKPVMTTQPAVHPPGDSTAPAATPSPSPAPSTPAGGPATPATPTTPVSPAPNATLPPETDTPPETTTATPSPSPSPSPSASPSGEPSPSSSPSPSPSGGEPSPSPSPSGGAPSPSPSPTGGTTTVRGVVVSWNTAVPGAAACSFEAIVDRLLELHTALRAGDTDTLGTLLADVDDAEAVAARLGALTAPPTSATVAKVTITYAQDGSAASVRLDGPGGSTWADGAIGCTSGRITRLSAPA